MAEASILSQLDTTVKLRPLINPLQQIRLLRISQWSTTIGAIDVVVKTLSTANQEGTDDGTKYIALSYVWGDSPASVHINVAGDATYEGRMPITQNLKDFLQKLDALLQHLYDQARMMPQTYHSYCERQDIPNHFRDLFAITQPANQSPGACIYVWADGLCIDQNNVLEKNVQVQRMGSIYRAASLVLVDLFSHRGERMYSMDVCLRTLRMAASGLGRDAPVDSTCSRVSNGQPFTLSLPYVKTLFRHPWWMRTWVVQEAVLAKELFLVTERQITSWDAVVENLERYAGVITKYGNPDREEMTYNDAEIQRLAHPMAFLETLRRAPYGHDLSWKQLDALLWECRHKSVGLEQDRAFALLGMCSSYDIAPDYQKHPDDIFIEASRTIIRSYTRTDLAGRFRLPRICPSHPLEHIALFHATEITLIKPSWPSRYDQRNSHSLITNYDPEVSVYSADGELCLFFSDLLQMVIHAAVQSKGRLLDVFVLEADEIGWASPRNRSPDGPKQALYCWWTHVQSHASRAELEERFVRTVFADRGADRRSRLPLPGTHTFQVFCERWVHEWLKDNKEDNSGQSTYPKDDRLVPLGLVEKDAKGCHDCLGLCTQAELRRRRELELLQDIATSWRFGVTKGGRFALLPSLARPGDVVSIVIGTSTPFLLRKVNAQESFSVVGRCYIEGIMDGETVSGLKTELEACSKDGMEGLELEKRLKENANLERIVLE